MAPERIQAVVRHLEDAADVGRLAPVEEEIGFGRVGVAIAVALKKSERDERVEKVARRARVQPEAPAKRVERLGAVRELAEHAKLDRAE